MDAAQRILLSYGQADGALRRLTEAGRILEIAPAVFRAGPSGSPSQPYEPLARDLYDSAVSDYRDDFADDVVSLWQSPAMRTLLDTARDQYKSSGGQFGLAPDWADLEATAIDFTVEHVVAGFGGALQALAPGHPLELSVSGIDKAARRNELVLAARQALQQNQLTEREVWLRFDGTARIRVLP